MRPSGVSARDISRRDALRALSGLAALAALGELAACSSSAQPPTRTSSTAPGTSPAAPSGDLLAGLRSFTGDWHRVAASAAENWTVSPLSIVLAFGMLRAGARTSSAAALDHVFGFAPSADPAGSLHAALHGLTLQVLAARQQQPGQPPPPVLSIANGVFLDQKFAPHVLKSFLQLIHAQYGTQVQELDLSTPRAVDTINGWASRETHGLIPHVLDMLDPTTVLVLADAVYLKAAWAEQFTVAQTRTGPFRTPSGSVTAPLMHQDYDELGYAEGPGWQRVDLPYASSDLTMRVVVPSQTLTTAAQLRPMVATAMSTSVHAAPRKVTLTLPKWRTSTGSDLNSALTALGAGVLFTDGADLTGIAPMLMVGQAVQRALISVDEKGTEAAAVTVVTLVPTSALDGEPKIVVADRPFAWAIVHEPTGVPLFAGHVVNPAA